MAREQRYRQEIQILSDYSNGVGGLDQYLHLYDKVQEFTKAIEPKAPIKPQEATSETRVIHFRKLVYFQEATEIPLRSAETWRILGLILRTRGLIRWLSFNFFSLEIEELERSYFLSRFALFRMMLRHREIIKTQIQLHVRYLAEIENHDSVLTVTQNDYFRAISGVKMHLPDVAILSTQGNFQPEASKIGTVMLKINWKDKKVSTLVSRLMEHDAKALLQLLLEFGVSDPLLQYMERNYPDARVYLDSQSSLKVVRMDNADRTFDQIAAAQGFHLKGDILENIEVWHQRFLLKEQILFEFDGAGSHRLPFVAGHWQYTIGSKIENEKVFINHPISREEPIPEAIFLSNRADENWFHLLLDTLPRYLFLKDLPPEIPVLIREDLPITTKEFLYQILDRPIIELRSNSNLMVKKLHLLAARSTCFDSISDEIDLQVSFSPIVIKLLVEWIKESQAGLQFNATANSVYFTRSSRQRRILNSQKIEKIVLAMGLEIVEDNESLYRNQVAIFSSLKMAAIPGGAMLANMIFMQPGSYILCLRSSRQNDLELWRKLAAAVELNYFEVTGPPSYHGTNILQRDHSNYLISSRKFRRILSEVMRFTT